MTTSNHGDHQEREEDTQETRTKSMDEASLGLESSSPGRVQDNESGADCQGSEEELPADFKVIPKDLDHSLIDTSDVDAWQYNFEKAKRKFGPYFVDEKQLELFCLLPLNNAQRVQLLQTIRANA